MITFKRIVMGINVTIAFYLVFGLLLTQNVNIFGDMFFSSTGFIIMFLFFLIEWIFLML
ncbi:MAG: hypothetical protein AABW72_06200 [archaeon]